MNELCDWFLGTPHHALEGYRKTGQSTFCENLKGSETFVVPLYEVTSIEKLKELLIDPLLALVEEEKRIA